MSGLSRKALAQQPHAIDAPKQLAGPLQHERRNAEHAPLLGVRRDRLALADPFAGGDRFVESGRIGTGFHDEPPYRLGVFDLEFSAPEALAESVVITAEHGLARPGCQQHADMRDRGIVDLACAADDQVAACAYAPRVHVGIADLAPVSLGPLFDRASVRALQIDRERQPGEFDVEIASERVGVVLDEIGERAAVGTP